MAHAIWNGSITFGIVNIPVQIQAAVHEHAIHFHQISKADKRRIHYRKVIEGSDDPIDDADIVKGYEVGAGTYVTFSDAELRALAARKSAVIEIERFVKLSDIDPRYFAALYYLTPDDSSAKPYHLLLQALADADRVGIARFIMHSKEHLVAVRSLSSVIALQTLHFNDEIINPDRLVKGSGHAAIAARELALAGQLIDKMTGRFTPGAYKDSYVARVSKAIARKAKGQAMTIIPDAESGRDEGNTLDLMAALERSLRGRPPATGAHSAAAGRAKGGSAIAALSHPRHRHPGRSRPHAS